VHPDKQEGTAADTASGHTADGEIWLDFEGTPIKWHIPVGVLYDQFCSLNNDNNEDPSLASYSTMLPWNLTVHYSKFPELEILHCESR
jgi:autophagy-related protein 5